MAGLMVMVVVLALMWVIDPARTARTPALVLATGGIGFVSLVVLIASCSE